MGVRGLEFCLPTNAAKVPAGPEWLHEIKHDGFRIRVERDGDRVRLITRGGKRYPWIAESALKNRIKQFVLDGEASRRRSRGPWLERRRRQIHMAYRPR
jgi:ATP-dependent DNA ligase